LKLSWTWELKFIHPTDSNNDGKDRVLLNAVSAHAHLEC